MADQKPDDKARDRIPDEPRQPPIGDPPKPRSDKPLGDRGQGDKTWSPPADEQGISNRENDEEPEDGSPSQP